MGDQEEMCLRAEQNALLGERGWGGDGDGDQTQGYRICI